MAIRLRRSGEALLLPVKVTPKGGRDVVLPYEAGDEAMRLKVSVPPADGKANAAVVALLADALKLSKSRLNIVSGEKSRHKQVAITLETPEQPAEVLASIAHALQSTPDECLIVA